MTKTSHVDLDATFYLTEIRLADELAYVEYLSEYDIYINTLKIPHPYTVNDAQAWIERITDQTTEHGRVLNFAIHESGGKLIGSLGFLDYAPQLAFRGHRAEIGYWLAKPYWGQGIMPRALEKLCYIGFRELNLQKITASVATQNIRSQQVVKKCGFSHEGQLRQHYQKDNQLIDINCYGLLRSEFINEKSS